MTINFANLITYVCLCLCACMRVCTNVHICTDLYTVQHLCDQRRVCVCVCMYVYASIRQSQDFLSRQRKIVNFCVDIDCTAPCGFTVVVCV